MMTINQWTALRLANASQGEDIDMAYKALDGLSPEQAEAELEEAVNWLYAVESAEDAEKKQFSELDLEFLRLVGGRAREKYRIALRLMKKFEDSVEFALRFARAELGDHLLAEMYEAGRDREASLLRMRQLACDHNEVWPVAVALFRKSNQYDLAA